MLVENYPVGWALDVSKPEPVVAYLIDLPGVAMQGRTMSEALAKLRAIAPNVLATYSQEGAVLPTPSREPSLLIGRVRWMSPARPTEFPRGSQVTEIVEMGGSIELNPA
jgi:predicted RNase H-like HicB family nuclease